MRIALTAGRPALQKGFEDWLAKGVTQSQRQLSDWLKTAVDEEARRAGLGNRLGKATRRTVFPLNRDSVDATLYFEARKNTNAVTLFDVFNSGATIRSKNGFWLAIPTPAVAKGRYRKRNGRMGRVTPGDWERATGIKLRFIYRRGKPSLLVADNIRLSSRGYARPIGGVGGRGAGPNTRLDGRASAVMFILVPQVTIRRRLNWQSLGRQAQAHLQDLLKVNLYR